MSEDRWTGGSSDALRLRGDEAVLMSFGGLWTLLWCAYLWAAHGAGVPMVMWASAAIFVSYGVWVLGQTYLGARDRAGRIYTIDEQALEVRSRDGGEVVLRVERALISHLSREHHRGGLVTLWARVDGGRSTPLVEMVGDGDGAIAMLLAPGGSGS